MRSLRCSIVVFDADPRKKLAEFHRDHAAAEHGQPLRESSPRPAPCRWSGSPFPTGPDIGTRVITEPVAKMKVEAVTSSCLPPSCSTSSVCGIEERGAGRA